MLGCLLGLVLVPASLQGQRVQLQDFFGSSQPNVGLPTPPNTLPSIPQNFPALPSGVIPNGLPQVGLPQVGLPQVGLPQVGLPQFDGFSPGSVQLPQLVTPPGIGQITPPSIGPSPNFPVFPRVTNPFPNPGRVQVNPATVPGFQAPGLRVPSLQAPGFQASPFRPPAYNQQPFRPVAPVRWPYEGTGSNWLPTIDWTYPKQLWANFQNNFLPRVLERPRARQTWIVGNSDNQLNLNELELATTLTLPNFLGSTQPLRISPGYIFHWIDGPDSTVDPDFDLPSRLNSIYLSFDHTTNPARNAGFENNLTVGFYSDYDNTSSDGIRVTGKLVGWSRVNEYTIGKLGVEYLDRIDRKLLPAFGVFMSPNPNIRWDLYFPRTKLAHRLPNLGDFEVWSYVGAEYGGGSWVIDRRDGTPDQADINDVRSFLGFEWMGPRRVTGFLEVGYVFDREIVYRSSPNDGLDVEDAFLFRSGLAF